MPFDKMNKYTIEVERLMKNYGKVRALRGISFKVERGEIFGFLGPNGAGKTTAIRCMLDLIRPTAGRIDILGHDAQRDSMAIRRRIGYLPDDIRLMESITARQLLDRYSRIQGLESVRLRELIQRFDVEVDRPLKGYSRGMRQKVGIVQAFMCNPELLILDEPNVGLDPLIQREVNAFLLEEAARGKTIFMSSHILSDVEKTCHRVGVIREGRMVAVEEVETLREKAGQVVTVEFDQRVDQIALQNIPGVSEINRHGDGRHYILKVTGRMDPLIKTLSRHQVLRLSVEEAPLEDIFIKFYESSGTKRRR
ncbi:MAG: ABC transporter ATP-binding protein [Dehalococcoidia bacterium]